MPKSKSAFSKITARCIMRNDYTFGDGSRALYLQIFLDGHRRKFPLEIQVKPTQWDADKMRIRKSHPDHEDLNLIISNALSKAVEIAVHCRLKAQRITLNQFEIMYFKNQTDSFIAFWEAKMEAMAPQLGDGTMRHHRAVLKKLKAYRPDVSFAELDFAFVQGFDRFLIRKYGNGFNTRMSNFSKLRRYVNMAIADGKMDKSPFEHFKISYQEGHRTALTQAQVRNLVQLHQDHTFKGGHHIALQNFLLGCFTGLRISDVYQIKKEMIDGNRLVFMPRKTSHRQKVIEIPLTAIAQKYINATGDGIAAKLSAAKTNEYLKDIAAKAEIHQNLTFHAARHTFATIYLELGGSVAVLQKILGHSDITTTMIYVHITNSRKEAEIGRFDDVNW